MTSDRRHGRGQSQQTIRDDAMARAGQRAVEKVAEKVTSKAEQLDRAAARASKRAEQLDRRAAKAAVKAQVLERIGAGLGAFDLWTRTEPTARRPRFTRDDLTAAAMRIADTEGFDALSMRRLAQELDVGTMTLYHYVRTKDELLTLVVDAAMGEVVFGSDEQLPADWREALTRIAFRSRASLLRHPWILDMSSDDPGIGPNSVRHFDQTLEALTSLDVSLADKLDIAAAVDEYVFGSCIFEREALDHADAIDAGMVAYMAGLVDSGDYPQLAALRDEYGLEEAWKRIEEHRRDPERFARNLHRLLEGIEADLHARTG